MTKHCWSLPRAWTAKVLHGTAGIQSSAKDFTPKAKACLCKRRLTRRRSSWYRDPRRSSADSARHGDGGVEQLPSDGGLPALKHTQADGCSGARRARLSHPLTHLLESRSQGSPFPHPRPAVPSQSFPPQPFSQRLAPSLLLPGNLGTSSFLRRLRAQVASLSWWATLTNP